MRDRTLRKRRCAPVDCQHIGVAVFADRAICSVLVGIIPRARAQLDNIGHHICADNETADTGTPVIVNLDDIPRFQPTGGGVIGVHRHRFTPRYLCFAADRPMIQLRMQFRFGLVRQ